ncbi:hypothetical protein ACP4OV_015785 [Aristida adscensionis]
MASNPSRRLPSMLLDKKVYLRGSMNETTATAESRDGYTLAFSLWMADPPGISFFSISPPDPRPMPSVFWIFPHVVGAEDRFVVFRARLLPRPSQPFSPSCRIRDEYFIYRAGRTPSLQVVPLPDKAGVSRSWATELAIVPLGDDGSQYLLAAFSGASDSPPARPPQYRLWIYSSERKEWITRIVPNLYPGKGKERFVPDKVITLGESVLGWVDFSCGLLECDLRQDPPCVRFIPLPEPFLGNREKLKPEFTFCSSNFRRSLRDLACVDGVVKFIEIEHLGVTETPCDPSDRDVFYDSDLIMLLESKDTDKKPKPTAGWRVVTWSRTLLSNCWRKGCTAHVDDIFVDESSRLSVLSGPGGEAVSKFAFRNLYSDLPTLSADDDDILYLKSTEQPKDQNGWIVAVDLRNKTVKAIQVFSFDGLRLDFLTCKLSRHLDMTPGIEVSACRENTKMVSSGSDLTHTPIGVAISGESRSRLPLRRPWPEEFNRQRNEAPNIARDGTQNSARNKLMSVVRNDHSSRDRRPGGIEEPTCKLPRLLLETKKAVHARIEAHNGVQNDHISWIHPVENNQRSSCCLDEGGTSRTRGGDYDDDVLPRRAFCRSEVPVE